MSPAELQRLADRLALEELVVRYADAIDRRDFAALDAVFAPDAYIDYRAMGGIDGAWPAIRSWLAQALAHFPAYMHLVGNCRFEIDGDAAQGRIACINPMVVAGAGGAQETMFLGLWYVDVYRRTPEGWRIVRRSEEKCFDFNVPESLRRALANTREGAPLL